MPNKKSAVKRVRQNEERRARNRGIKHAMNTTIAHAQKAIDKGDITAAEALLPQVQSVADKTSRKGVIHANKTARKLSRLMQKFNAVKMTKNATTNE